MQIFNQFNARKIKDEYNIFAGIWKSQMFIYVAAIILAFQVGTLYSLCTQFYPAPLRQLNGELTTLKEKISQIHRG